MIEAVILSLYLLACIGIGYIASRRVLTSNDDYWVAGRGVGTWTNAIAIMATLASGGSVVGVMGYAYKSGIPATLSLFAGAVVGFPLASMLVAKPLRNFGRYTITDFLGWRYDSPLVRVLVPILIVVTFTAYMVAQLKAAGLTAEVLLGVDYKLAIIISMIVFVGYVSFGGMLAVTWTDVMQGSLMLVLVVGAAAALWWQYDGTAGLLQDAVTQRPQLGEPSAAGWPTMAGSFLVWATAIPVIPHVVMRVYTAKDARGARMSLNLAMVGYSVIVLAAVFVIVPIGVIDAPNLAAADADRVFHMVIQNRFPPVIRGIAVAAVIAAVMSTTDALLLACSSAVAHDLVAPYLRRKNGGAAPTARIMARVNFVTVSLLGLIAMVFALNPPELLTQFYSAAIGWLGAALFVPLIAGLWWKRATRRGGEAALLVGGAVYAVLQFGGFGPTYSAILWALPAGLLAMIVGSYASPAEPERVREISRLHELPMDAER
ncbi:MAG: SSS family transporter [Flavobacteriales bacterium]|jgi:SSS family transporter